MKKLADAKFRAEENVKNKTRMHERRKNPDVREMENANSKIMIYEKLENQIVRAVENAINSKQKSN